LKENTGNERKIFDTLRAMKPAGTMKVKVCRNPGKKEPERIAVMEYQCGKDNTRLYCKMEDRMFSSYIEKRL